MKYELDYQGATEILEDRLSTGIQPKKGDLLENSYLTEFDQDILEEAERLNAVLPLIKWEVDNNDLSEAMSDELYLYYEDLLKGRLDGILDEEEAPIIIKDLTESYIKAFGKDTLDEEDKYLKKRCDLWRGVRKLCTNARCLSEISFGAIAMRYKKLEMMNWNRVFFRTNSMQMKQIKFAKFASGTLPTNRQA